MAKFHYIYRTSDRRKLEAEIEADSRDEVFHKLRMQAIRPIKVIALDGTKANGEITVAPLRRKVVFWVVTSLLAVACGIVAFLAVRSIFPNGRSTDTSPEIAYSIASPLMRQTVPGNRMRISDAVVNAFTTVTERTLAQFAEPGREFYIVETRPTPDDVKKALDTPLRYADNELSEVIDLKRIVTGMKRELNNYILAGGTWDSYFEQLVNRQKLEMSYRRNAYQRIHDVLDGENSNNAKAYDLWLKANAQLQTMGIYPIPLPDALRDFQFNLNLDE